MNTSLRAAIARKILCVSLPVSFPEGMMGLTGLFLLLMTGESVCMHPAASAEYSGCPHPPKEYSASWAAATSPARRAGWLIPDAGNQWLLEYDTANAVRVRGIGVRGSGRIFSETGTR